MSFDIYLEDVQRHRKDYLNIERAYHRFYCTNRLGPMSEIRNKDNEKSSASQGFRDAAGRNHVLCSAQPTILCPFPKMESLQRELSI